MNVSGNQMNLRHFHDFYLLEAMRAGITMAKSAHPDYAFRKAVTRLESDVEAAFETLSATMAKRIWVYLWGAALGEVVYAHENCDEGIDELREVSFTYRLTFDYYPTEENIDTVKNVFSQYWHSGGYGGDLWAMITNAVGLYGNIPNAAFIDHAVDLEHNGGCVFDKTGSASPLNLNCFGGYGGDSLKHFLNHKFAHDILNRDMDYQQIFASRKVHSLLTRYNNIIEKIGAVDFVDVSIEWLQDITITWSDDAYDNTFTVVEASSRYSCAHCGDSMGEDEGHWIDEELVCCNCSTYCEKCGEYVMNDDTQWIDGEGETWCDSCAEDVVTCEECNKDYNIDNTTGTEDGYNICTDCVNDCTCEHCGEVHYNLPEHVESEHTEDETTGYVVNHKIDLSLQLALPGFGG